MIESEERTHRCCFTGHRPEKLDFPESEVNAKLQKEIRLAIADGINVFITGMAPGVDIWAAEIVLDLILDPSSRLGHLECQNTLMEVLNIPNPENMWQLQCGGNPNLHLDFTLYPNLTILGMNNMGLTSLDFLGDLKSQLTWLSVQSNQLTSITLSPNCIPRSPMKSTQNIRQ